MLSTVSQAPPRADHSGYTTATPVAVGQAPRGDTPRVSGMSTTEWLDPGANKKKRDVRTPVEQSTTAAGPPVPPTNHSQSITIDN